MSTGKVWLRFEKKKKDGTVWKLRIQDMPLERLDETIDLRLKYFARDEVVHRATGITKNLESLQFYKEYLRLTMQLPIWYTVICCEDNGEEVGDIIGLSGVALVEEEFDWNYLIDKLQAALPDSKSVELRKLIEVFQANSNIYSAIKEFNLGTFLDDGTVLVLPEYRGYGIAQQLLHTRRLMCAALNVPKTGGWMTGFGSQIGAARDGWETVFEINYDVMARTHNLVFEDAPPTMKYMIAGPYPEK